MERKGFTLIELMAVIAIIGILLGIVTTSVAGAMKYARGQKANALVKCVKEGAENYRAQKGKYPGIGDRAQSGALKRSNNEGYNNQSDYEQYELDGAEVRSVVRELVEESVFRANPMLDVSALFVSAKSTGEPGTKGVGYDFNEAIHGSERTKEKMKVSQMYFGYPETDRGWFRRFRMVYKNSTGVLEVGRQ
ncbi:MAG: prepilin-type N-terminal cleavage/methylation domain-containing protein [Kiritimatiellae bacterium]|nr:prepilin-type N-terminal cleavage/methylation domain-containing protein [Kiritimatiellia bacterium]